MFSFEICENFKNTFFYKTPLVPASEQLLEVLYKKGVLKNFSKFIEKKNKYQSLFFNNVTGWGFPVNFANFLKMQPKVWDNFWQLKAL